MQATESVLGSGAETPYRLGLVVCLLVLVAAARLCRLTCELHGKAFGCTIPDLATPEPPGTKARHVPA